VGRKVNNVDGASSSVRMGEWRGTVQGVQWFKQRLVFCRTKLEASSTKSGQAMAEFLLGLVAIMLLMVGLQQVSIVSRKSFDAYVNSRGQVARMQIDPNSDYIEGFEFAETVDPGNDGKNYTGDDEVVVGDDSFYTEGRGFLHMVDYALLEGYLWDWEREDHYYKLSDSAFSSISESFSMFYGLDYQEVEVVPFLDKVVGRETILLERGVWMPWWGGLIQFDYE